MTQKDLFTYIVNQKAEKLAKNIAEHAGKDFTHLYTEELNHEQIHLAADNYINCCMAQELALNLSKTTKP
jgi:hypothetical protein